MTRNGKIARLPVSIRNVLNQRLYDGESGIGLVDWLNGLTEVQKVMQTEFGGRPISEQNLSEWKQGGYEDWHQHQRDLDWLRTQVERSAELRQQAGNTSIADSLSTPLAVALGRRLQQAAAAAPNDAEEGKALFTVAREILQLRRQDHEEERLRLERERWGAEAQRNRRVQMQQMKEDVRELQRDFPEVLDRFEEIFKVLRRRFDAIEDDGSTTPDEDKEAREVFAEIEAFFRERAARKQPAQTEPNPFDRFR